MDDNAGVELLTQPVEQPKQVVRVVPADVTRPRSASARALTETSREPGANQAGGKHLDEERLTGAAGSDHDDMSPCRAR